MASESVRHKQMEAARSYVGALFEEERRLVLVSVDPNRPWEAFRQLRRVMRRERSAVKASINLFNSDSPLGRQADVIPLAARRRAG